STATGVLFSFTSYFLFSSFFFCSATAPTDIYTLSLHDALPISTSICGSEPRGSRSGFRSRGSAAKFSLRDRAGAVGPVPPDCAGDRKSTRLNSSHDQISYAAFCLKKKRQDLRGLRLSDQMPDDQ